MDAVYVPVCVYLWAVLVLCSSVIVSLWVLSDVGVRRAFCVQQGSDLAVSTSLAPQYSVATRSCFISQPNVHICTVRSCRKLSFSSSPQIA